MSVEAVDRKSGRVWRVRWRDEQGNARSRVLGRKQDAIQFDAEIKRQKRLGALDLFERGSETLGEFVEEWWEKYALPNLAERTRDSYAKVWDRHVLPYLGDVRLRDFTADVVTTWAAGLRQREVGEPTIYRAMMLLSGVLTKAHEWGRIAENPVRRVPKPSIRRVRMVRPFAPEEVERMRSECWRQRDRAIIGFLAYAGLRPQELFALRWEDIGDNAIYIDKATRPKKGVKVTKTLEPRRVRVRPPLARVLTEWREHATDTSDHVILRSDGTPFNDVTWQSWHKDVWKPVTGALGIEARPYDLRHTFVSQLIREGRSVIEVAKEAGHAPTMTLNVYGHLFDDQAES